jgi:hypothetical protein
MASLTEKYQGFAWIKVKSAPAVIVLNDMVTACNFREYEAHHVAETDFLIAEVRKLAAELDDVDDKVTDLDYQLQRALKWKRAWKAAAKANFLSFQAWDNLWEGKWEIERAITVPLCEMLDIPLKQYSETYKNHYYLSFNDRKAMILERVQCLLMAMQQARAEVRAARELLEARHKRGGVLGRIARRLLGGT